MTVQNVKDYVELCWNCGRFYEELMTTKDPKQHSSDTAYRYHRDDLPVPRLKEELGTFRSHAERLNAHDWNVIEGISDA